ncbi:hypothetical protein MHBO_003101 [Bonamia ostreae]|uniref:Zinc finger PHD-type domain-containing protein n=1 Tax=Bonamia ostreae TaxID=126728 RepID=A0ABV2APG6_9EUKA
MEALKSSNKSLETTVKLNENNFKFQAKKESSDLCVCNNPKEEKNVFYIGCDICEKWYHGKCVRINEDFSKFIDKYFCFRCINNKTPTQGKCILKKFCFEML